MHIKGLLTMYLDRSAHNDAYQVFNPLITSLALYFSHCIALVIDSQHSKGRRRGRCLPPPADKTRRVESRPALADLPTPDQRARAEPRACLSRPAYSLWCSAPCDGLRADATLFSTYRREGACRLAARSRTHRTDCPRSAYTSRAQLRRLCSQRHRAQSRRRGCCCRPHRR